MASWDSPAGIPLWAAHCRTPWHSRTSPHNRTPFHNRTPSHNRTSFHNGALSHSADSLQRKHNIHKLHNIHYLGRRANLSVSAALISNTEKHTEKDNNNNNNNNDNNNNNNYNNNSSSRNSIDWAPRPEELCLQDTGGPNEIVLEAQAQVCTGPTQTRPLSEEQLLKVLHTIISSARGELPESERVSLSQLGAFFGAMSLRANAFPERTTLQEGELRAMRSMWLQLKSCLPEEVLFLADPEGSLFGDERGYTGGTEEERRLVTAMREILFGGHLGFEETLNLLQSTLPLRKSNRTGAEQDPRLKEIGAEQGSRLNEMGAEQGLRRRREGLSDALVAAYLICQRMNKETDRELKAFCLAFDQDLGPAPVADVASLTHYGEPYDGSVRFFRPTLFVAAVRASYGESCLMHGVPWMPPKGGVTEAQQLSMLGANISLLPTQAATLLEDPELGFAYLSQKECCPSLYSLMGMRKHIKKRPTFATTEKVQRFVHAKGRESMMAGFYHEGYEEPLLMLMRRLPVDAGLVIKGEEGSLALMTRPNAEDASKKGRAVNYCAGFRPIRSQSPFAAGTPGIYRESFSIQLDASEVGILPTLTPRIDRSAEKNLKLGMAALSGEKGPAYDRIVFNAAVADHLLGCKGAEDLKTAVERARAAVDSGRAIGTLLQYVEDSCKFDSS